MFILARARSIIGVLMTPGQSALTRIPAAAVFDRHVQHNHVVPGGAAERRETYYWTVVPRSDGRAGRCLSGTWSFKYLSGVPLPEVRLLSPMNGSTIATEDVELVHSRRYLKRVKTGGLSPSELKALEIRFSPELARFALLSVDTRQVEVNDQAVGAVRFDELQQLPGLLEVPAVEKSHGLRQEGVEVGVEQAGILRIELERRVALLGQSALDRRFVPWVHSLSPWLGPSARWVNSMSSKIEHSMLQ
jgi:hypothetical protein